jgi:hypothetical protein
MNAQGRVVSSGAGNVCRNVKASGDGPAPTSSRPLARFPDGGDLAGPDHPRRQQVLAGQPEQQLRRVVLHRPGEQELVEVCRATCAGPRLAPWQKVSSTCRPLLAQEPDRVQHAPIGAGRLQHQHVPTDQTVRTATCGRTVPPAAGSCCPDGPRPPRARPTARPPHLLRPARREPARAQISSQASSTPVASSSGDTADTRSSRSTPRSHHPITNRTKAPAPTKTSIPQGNPQVSPCRNPFIAGLRRIPVSPDGAAAG